MQMTHYPIVTIYLMATESYWKSVIKHSYFTSDSILFLTLMICVHPL